ncbi:FMN-binding glutamate synthase family protein [Arundinibacter roseus]|uniref:FMN-binding glutamate synthase family protein n=1 Tax=Arundinibacter roseus TaxID=2070510 RepID=A0A4R4KJT2_9BACT|nr:FMN-binding glutamate synthase family protein [Arundinibacter roseus]TDB68253.1 FMN-binding glutamate synthase family protein [Arundinibacter roseus]
MQVLLSLPWWVYVLVLLLVLAMRDMLQKKHTIQHNFPLVGHLRYMIEKIGPELRQYIVANNREELPFNRRQRSWIYASSKKENNYQGFGTDQNMHEAGYIFIKPALFPTRLPKTHPHHIHNTTHLNHYLLPAAKVIGLAHGRRRPYRPRSVVNISAMSYGSLSANAVEALNKGSLKFGNFHNTGEGGLSPYHSFGADVVFNMGTAYFGVRDDDGNFVLEKLVQMTQQNPFVRMIELKLSQGAKPGKGGLLPGSKITAEIAAIRHVPLGKDVVSPAYHSAFTGVQGMIDFIEEIAEATGLPVGIKAAVGKLDLWEELADLMALTGKGPDFIAIDGGEGGTGAAPPAFADHVALPWVHGFSKVYTLFQKRHLTEKITFIGSGKLGLPAHAIMAFAMGADIVNIAREAMLSIGCIQAQICHTNRCPTGVATNNPWLQAGLDPTLKSERFYNYMKTITKEIIEITHAAGYEHPCQFTMDDVEVAMGDNNHTLPLLSVYNYAKDEVPYSGFDPLITCAYLGGSGNAVRPEQGGQKIA